MNKTWYQIAILNKDGSKAMYAQAESWSKYYERLADHTAEWAANYAKNKSLDCWPKWDVYGLTQVREHLAELRAKEPKKHFVIIETTEKMIE